MAIKFGDKLLRKASAALELPKELALNLPVVTAVGTEELLIENYKNLMEYGDLLIRIRTVSGVMQIEGQGLLLSYVTKERICVKGRVGKIALLS